MLEVINAFNAKRLNINSFKINDTIKYPTP